MRKWLILAFCLVCGSAFFQDADAINFWDFDPGRIIDDAVFYNADTMSAAEIQRFLDAKVPVCETNWESHGYMWAVAPCLKDYKETTKSRPADQYCKEYIGGENQSAAEIIWGVSQACGINPQAILVILQKEQGLVTDKWPRDSWLTNSAKANYQYRSAMGMGCPDNDVCNSEYYGFYNQVYYGARQYKRYQALPTSYEYRAGRNNTIQWKPNTGCGTSTVYIQNQATAGLYNYTPYRPNNAALAAGFGTGDGCSSYGNRNFWGYFTSWFGSTHYIVLGEMNARWQSLGGKNGYLGSPVANEVCVWGDGKDNCFQDFVNGRMYWTPTTGAWPVYGEMNERYKYLEAGNGSLGYPVGMETCGIKDGGCFQNFQNGVIIWSYKTGAWESMGKIRERWASLSYEYGKMGYPTSGIVCGLVKEGCYQDYQNGALIYSSNTSVWESMGKIRERWAKLNYEYGKMGYPVGPIEQNKWTGIQFQRYENGYIVGQNKTGYWESNGDIRERWAVTGFEGGAMGYPTGPVTCTLIREGCYQSYERGAILYSPASGAWESLGGIRQYWSSLGWENATGYPIGPEVYRDRVWSQEYELGTIHIPDGGAARFIWK